MEIKIMKINLLIREDFNKNKILLCNYYKNYIKR